MPRSKTSRAARPAALHKTPRCTTSRAAQNAAPPA